MAPIKVGVLLVNDVIQFLDVAVVDLLSITTKEYLQPLSIIPESIRDKGTDIQFLYINEKGAGTVFDLTGGLKVHITHGLEDAGQLDYLFVPGPYPDYRPTAAERAFIIKQFPGLTLLMGICSGTLVLADVGVLDGLEATGPRGLLPMYKEKWPKVNWVEKRWEVAASGKIWTSGAVTNGNDAVAAFVRATFDKDLAAIVCSGAGVGDRSQYYPDQAQA